MGAILHAHGEYIVPDRISEKDLLASHYHLVYCKPGQMVEVHWNLVKRYFDIPSLFWWEGTTKGTFQQTEIIELEPEKYLLYTIFRLFDHQFAPLKFLVLVAEQVNSQPEIDWEKFEGYAEKYGMKRLVIFVLKLAGDLLNSCVPEFYVHYNFAGYGFLRKLIVEGCFTEGTSPHLRTLIYTCFFLPPGRLFAVLLGRIFPSKSEIRLRYGIPEKSFKVYIYFLLNPVLMMLRRTSTK